MQSKARIIFAGSPEFAVPSLDALLRSHHDVVGVLTQPDRPSGRGRQLHAGPVKQAAAAANVSVMQPLSLGTPEAQAALCELQPDLVVVVAYGMLLPPAVLDIPGVACINVHASLLPRWRGASPIQSAVLAGDDESGISIMQMDAGLDTGPVYCRESMHIEPGTTAGDLHDRLALFGGELLDRSLEPILSGDLQPVPQPVEGVTYAGRINKSDGILNWNDSAAEIERAIRAYNPWPVAQTTYNGEQLRCWSCNTPTLSANSSNEPGTVVGVNAEGIQVQTGDGILTLTEVQMPGRKRIKASQFANAHPLSGVLLGK